MSSQLKLGITCYPTFGGSGVVATELGLALAEQGHEVHFITSRLPARLAGQSMADVSFHEVNTYSYALFRHEPYTLALAAKMAAVAETFELDLLHVHYAIPHAISAHLAQEMLGGKIKIVTTLHGTDITLVGNDPSLHAITKFAIEHSDAVTAVSQWLANETITEFSPEIEIDVISNFVNTEQFRPDLSQLWPGHTHCSGNHPHIIHVSNFRPVKQAPLVVEIFAKILGKHDAHLLMVGDGPDLQGAVKRAKELSVTHRVSFLGNREDVAYLLSASDIMLMPSESESFGLAALEAMACGCAVVASEIGGIPELVHHREDGFLCTPGDVSQFAEYASALLENPELLEAVKRAARQRAVEQYTTEIVVKHYIDLYRATLDGSKGAAHV